MSARGPRDLQTPVPVQRKTLASAAELGGSIRRFWKILFEIVLWSAGLRTSIHTMKISGVLSRSWYDVFDPMRM